MAAAADSQAAGELSSASLLRTSCRITRILTPITRNRPPSELLLDESKLQVEVNGHTVERWRRIGAALDDPQMAAALKIAKDNRHTLAQFLLRQVRQDQSSLHMRLLQLWRRDGFTNNYSRTRRLFPLYASTR